MMEYKITATVKGIDENRKALKIGVLTEGCGNPAILQYFNSEIFEAILKAMKNANKSAFMDAMIAFTGEELNGENDDD